MQNTIQILKQTRDGLVFDTKQLFNILDSIGDKNISIVSITGKPNSGKSLLINHFVRFLTPNKISKNCGYFANLSNGNNQIQACGIWMCAEPFVVTADDGSEMVLLLMETRCNFDDERCLECGVIFAISLLLSSTLILNIQNNVTEDVMKFVEHFTLFAQSLNDESKPELFQRLVFLVKDWDNECAYRYGHHDHSTVDSNNYMKHIIMANNNQCTEGQSTRQRLLDCFDDISCHLMPHPGKYVSKSIRFINREFREKVEEFVALILRDLTVKTIGGQKLTVNSLNHYLNKWQQIISSHLKFKVESQSPLSDVKSLEVVFQKEYDEYETNMLSCIESNPTDDQLMTSHNNAEEEFWECLRFEIDSRVNGVSDECLNEMIDSFRATIANRYQYYRNKNSERIETEENSTELIDNSLSTCNVLNNSYSRNSFDRFGDDLCEHILRYLSFKNKIRFECVNKQWKRLVFRRQYRLDITDSTNKSMDRLSARKLLRSTNYVCQHFIKKYEKGLEKNIRNNISYIEPVLRKCTNICNINIDTNCYYNDWKSNNNNNLISANLLMRIIADNCHHLLLIEYKVSLHLISKNVWQYFGQKFGQTLQSITFCHNNRSRRPSLLNYCPNLLRISGIDLKYLFVNEDNSALLPKLFEVRHAVDCDKIALMDLFVAKYTNIKVFQCHLYTRNCYTLMSQISQLNKLEKLMLETSLNVNDLTEFIDGIRKLSCNKQLKHLDLDIDDHCTITTELCTQLLTAINCISSLKYLKINMELTDENPVLSVKLLANCTQLTHLYIDGISGNNFCTGIQSYLPQIKHFSCK